VAARHGQGPVLSKVQRIDEYIVESNQRAGKAPFLSKVRWFMTAIIIAILLTF